MLTGVKQLHECPGQILPFFLSTVIACFAGEAMDFALEDWSQNWTVKNRRQQTITHPTIINHLKVEADFRG